MTAPRWRSVLAGAVALLVLTEIGVRQAGLVDFPTYIHSSEFGYVPKSDQSGAFMGTNRWVFNDRSLGTERPWRPSERFDILLIGNSIIMGGNPYDQKDKVASGLQARLGDRCPVWPIAAGGWSTVNEVRFLQANLDIVDGADFFVWEIMAGQMAGVAPWTKDTTHPLERPVWATGYLLKKALTERLGLDLGGPPPAPPRANQTAENFRSFDQTVARLARSARNRPTGVIFLYPDRQQLALARAGKEWMDDREQVAQIARAHGAMLIDIAAHRQWTEAQYKDGVHPTIEGNRVLASILADAVTQAGGRLACLPSG